MNIKGKVSKIKEARSIIHLCRVVLDEDELTCACGEPWEISREAVSDFSGSDLLAFDFDMGFPPHLIKCPACNKVDDDLADKMAPLLKAMPQDDEDPIEVIEDLMR